MRDRRHLAPLLAWPFLLAIVLAGARPVPAQEESSDAGNDSDRAGIPTQVTVRAVATDAKVIGSNVGGARIRVEAVRSGRVLAEGIQQGGTGDTELIVQAPRERGATVYGTEGAAGFRTTLNLSAPTLVDVTAIGPLGSEPPYYRASRRMLLVPGRDVTGEGIVLELSGFTVELLQPSESVVIDPGSDLSVRTRVTMLCGCGTEPGGMWDANRYAIEARLLQDGRPVARTSLSYAGTMSTYEGTLENLEPGSYTLQVLAMDAARSNFGRAESAVVVPE